MKWATVVIVALIACKGGEKKSVTEMPAPPRHVAPKGTIAGKPFAPNVVLLLEDSDGGKLGLVAATNEALRDRHPCEEPMGSASAFEITKSAPIADWKVGAPLTSELDAWSATGVAWNAHPKGSAKVTLTTKDAKALTVEGTIEITGDGWSLSGPFEGDYCPTKAVKRDDKLPWTMAPITVAAVPTTPLEAIVAGVPTKIVHVTLREVPYYDGTKRQRFVFYTAKPPEPCSARPDGGHARMYSHGALISEAKPEFQADSFALDLVAVPTAGAALTGNSHSDHGEKRDQIVDADLQVFEPDGYRSWRYSQYYSAALAVDAVTDAEVRAHVQLSLPDEGKSMLLGSFTATRCPPQTD